MIHEIEEGLQIDSPNLFIPWKISEKRLKKIFKDFPLRHITDGYYTAKVTLFEGVTCLLGFHFGVSLFGPPERKSKGKLTLLEFSRDEEYYLSHDMEDSYFEFQEVFERVFNKPHDKSNGYHNKYKKYAWSFNDIGIFHMTSERSEPEERLMIAYR